MYRSASRYESRSIPEKASRSARPTWIEPQESRPYSTTFEADDGGLPRDPYLADDARILDARDYQHKGTSSGADLREAQRLAANFFSQHPSASAGPEPAYRDAARLVRPLSPDVSVERYRSRGLHRDRDVGGDRWSGRPNSEASLSSGKSQLLLEDWEEERVPVDVKREWDIYGEASTGWRKRDERTWDETDYDYGVGRKEPDYSAIQTAVDLDGGLRITKRVDWTGLLRPDGSAATVEDGFRLDLPLGNRGSTQAYRGVGLPYVDSPREVLEEELNREESAYSGRGGGYYGSGSYREMDVLKEPRGGYVDKRFPESDENLLRRSFVWRGGERGRGREDWKVGREPNAAAQGQRVYDLERGRDKRRFEDRDSRRPFYSSSSPSAGGSGSDKDRERGFSDNVQVGNGRGGSYGAKRDFSQRASITNQDILAVYYGNKGSGRQPNKFGPTRGYVHPGPSRHYTPPDSEEFRLRRPPLSPARGRPGRHRHDADSFQRGQKRWEKHPAEGSEVKRFKRETQSDKLYLMHNNRAKSEEKGQEAVASVTDKEPEDMTEGNVEASQPAALEDVQDTAEAPVVGGNEPVERTSLWDVDDSWSDSEDEEEQAQMTWNEPFTNDTSGLCEPTGEEREQAALQSLQVGAVNDSKKFLGECSEDDNDDDAHWESLASDLDDQLDEGCVHQGLEADGAITENPDREGVVLANSEARASEEDGRVGTLSVAQSQDSEMVDIDNSERSEESKKDVAEVDSSLNAVSVGFEKKKVAVIMEELQESVKNREDKAFDNYVSLFEQDTDLMKLYETNVNSGSFECLVCAGVGAKKKKRFPDVASLVQHAKKVLRTKKLPEHRGFARAVCKILGWESVPGPSVILPRGCIPPQESEPIGITDTVPTKQPGGGGNTLGIDWEWAAARQLFEEQEARIDLTIRSSGDGTNPDTAQGPDNLVTVVETTMIREKASSGDVISVPENASGKVFVLPDKRSLTEVVATAVQTVGVLSGLEKSEVAKVVSASELLAMGEPISATQNSTLPRTSLVYEISKVSAAGEKDLAPSFSETLN